MCDLKGFFFFGEKHIEKKSQILQIIIISLKNGQRGTIINSVWFRRPDSTFIFLLNSETERIGTLTKREEKTSNKV